MDYRLLGPLEVRGTDGPLPLGGAKQRALLALLLLNANRVVPRARRVDELWGEQPPETAVGTVQVYVSRLRKLLPDGSLATRPSGYTLELEPDDLDLARFERLTADARTAEPERASRLLREALDLWRGPALAEFDEPFAGVEGGRLEELRLAALEDRIDADLALGHHGELVGELEVLIAERPHRERLRGQLMLALYRSGRQAEALEAYRAARATLDELGLEPGAPLKRLERQVLAQDASLDHARSLTPAPALPVPGPLVPSSPFPFVGREPELESLRSLIERARGGEGAFVLLAGEPGAGKTRLVRELAHRAVHEGVLVCYGASGAAVQVPYQAVRDWLEFVLRVSDPQALGSVVGESGDALVRLAPGYAALTGREQVADTTADPYVIQAAVAEFLRRLAGRRPLLLVAEDIHWADAESLAILGRLARMAPEARIVVIATYRKPGEDIGVELADAVADFSRLEGVQRVTLGSLSAADLGAFVREAANAEASDDLVAGIGELTDGTPLLVCELWRDLVAGNALEISDTHVTLARPLAEIRGPERIGELLEHRLSRLSPETRALIELAAVTGPRFVLGVVADAAGLDRAGLTIAVEQGARSGIIEELPTSPPAGRFTHELLRRGVYDRISGVRRTDLHLRVGEALEGSHGADSARVLPELAHHFTLAAPLAGTERAVDYNLRAAQAAMASVAYREAAARLATALELGIADPRERARVQGELGHLYHETGRIADADAVLTASFEAATSVGERGLAMRALVQRANERLASDPQVSSAEIVPLAEEAIEAFEQAEDTLGLAMAEHLLGHALGREGKVDDGYAALDRALAYAEAAGDQLMARHIIGRRARGLCDGPTPALESIAAIEHLRASKLNHPALDAGLRRSLALFLSMVGRFDEALQHIEASDLILEQAVETDFTLQSRWTVANALELAGDLVGAEERYVAAFLYMRDARGQESDARAMRIASELALMYCDQRRWDDAVSVLAYGGDIDGDVPVRGKLYSFFRFAARGRLAAHRGETAEAVDLVQRAVEVADRSKWLDPRARVWLALAEVLGAGGRNAEADAARATAIALYEQKGNVTAANRARVSLH
jgi:predicted ATPase/DNA-binding SARP family transcriptional activator